MFPPKGKWYGVADKTGSSEDSYRPGGEQQGRAVGEGGSVLEWRDEFIEPAEDDEGASTQTTPVLTANLSSHERIFIMSRWSITDSLALVTKLHVPLLGYIEVD